MNGTLSPYQRLIFGCVENGVYSTVALLEAVVLYYYNTKLNVRLEYLGLSSFVIGTLAAFVAVIAGNVSDRSKFPSRRKAYLLLFGPLYGAGLCLRYGAFTSQEQAPLYYVVTFALQVAGYTGQAVVMQAWGVELVSDVGERSMLYAYTTGCSFGGVFAGLVLANLPLQLSAFIVPCILAVGISLCVFHLPDSTPLSKRAFVPTMTNVSSVFWNSQFMVYLVASSFVAFINTLPSLVMFFIRYCVGIGTTNLTKYYSACIGAFGVMGIAGLPLIKGIVEKHGTLSCVKSCLAVAAAMGLAVLGCSYVSIYLIIACFGIIGLFSTMANVVLAIIYAQSIDYDELLCGKKRASSYSGVHTPIRIFIQIAGASVPLVLMSAVGFQSPGGSDDASSSTASASLVLRLWCSVFMTCCMVAAYVAISYFKIDSPIFEKIRQNIAHRDIQNIFSADAESTRPSESSAESSFAGPSRPLSARLRLESGAGSFKSTIDRVSSEFSSPADIVGRLISSYHTPEGQQKLAGIYAQSRPMGPSDASGEGDSCGHSVLADVMLSSVDDPVTNRPVEPPPFAHVTQLIGQTYPSVLLGGASKEGDSEDSKKDESSLRLIALYFPEKLHLCYTDEGRTFVVQMYWVELAVFSAVSCYAAWQAIVALANQNQDVAYLTVFLTVVYILYLAYLVSMLTGVLVLRSLQVEPRPAVDNMVKTIVKLVHQSKELSPGGVTNVLHPTDLYRIDSEGTGHSVDASQDLNASVQRISVASLRLGVTRRLVFCILSVGLIIVAVHV